MKLQEKQKELEQEIIANLRAIPKMPEGLLPHTVYVRSVTSEIIHREREHPHLFDLVFPEKSFQVVRVSRTSVPAGVHESGDLRLKMK